MPNDAAELNSGCKLANFARPTKKTALLQQIDKCKCIMLHIYNKGNNYLGEQTNAFVENRVNEAPPSSCPRTLTQV